MNNSNSNFITTSCTCKRCGGSGYLPQYRHVENGICFLCRGNKTVTYTTYENPTIESNYYGLSLANLKVGQILFHEKFGAGTLLKIEGKGLDTFVSINFEKLGLKKILLRFAQLYSNHKMAV